jgi:acetyl esterase/lipase
MLLRLYPHLFHKDEQTIFMGDSAGGNVALALVLAALRPTQTSDVAPPVPHAVFLISPCADAKNDNPAMRETDKNDPLLSVKYTGEVAEAWAKGLADRDDPLVSPTYGDLDALRRRGVRLDGIVGTWDVLCPDTLVLLDKAAKTGITGEWLLWEKQMHCFPLIW